METNGTGTRVLALSNRFLGHRYLPAILAIGVILVMLPALKTGLGWDDLMQRAVELKPSQLPPRMHETGNPVDSGIRLECPTYLAVLIRGKGSGLVKMRIDCSGVVEGEIQAVGVLDHSWTVGQMGCQRLRWIVAGGGII